MCCIVVGFILTTASYFVQPSAPGDDTLKDGISSSGSRSSSGEPSLSLPGSHKHASPSAAAEGRIPNGGVHFYSSLAGLCATVAGLLTVILVAAEPKWVEVGWRLHVQRMSRRRGSKAVFSFKPASPTCTGTSTTAIVDNDYGFDNDVDDDNDDDEEDDHGVAVTDDPTAPLLRPAQLRRLETPGLTREEIGNLKMIIRLLPYCAFMVFYWASNSQMSSNFLLQACQMNLLWFVDPARGSSQVGVAFLTVFNTLIICLLVPVVRHCLYPCIKKCRGRTLSAVERMSVGFVFTTLSTIAAAIVEVLRRQSPLLAGVDDCCKIPVHEALFNRSTCCSFSMGGGNREHCLQSCQFLSTCSSDSRPILMHSYSVWWQSIQYTLTGISEVFGAISAMEFFYTKVCFCGSCNGDAILLLLHDDDSVYNDLTLL